MKSPATVNHFVLIAPGVRPKAYVPRASWLLIRDVLGLTADEVTADESAELSEVISKLWSLAGRRKLVGHLEMAHKVDRWLRRVQGRPFRAISTDEFLIKGSGYE